MYQRFMKKELEALAKSYPVVTVVGPRQSGKTILVRATFPDKPYVDLYPNNFKNWYLGNSKVFAI
jgi:predicted AAA+ superfamily ATPase